MAAPWVETVRRIPMSWDEYNALGDEVRGEYYDGCLVMTPPPLHAHQIVSRRIATLLDSVVPADCTVIMEAGWSPRTGQGFVPDVMVYLESGVGLWLQNPPALAVEVLSANRSADLVVKSAKYAAAGLQNYWIVDRENRQLLVLRPRDSIFEVAQTVTADSPAEVDFGIASVRIDLGELLAS